MSNKEGDRNECLMSSPPITMKNHLTLETDGRVDLLTGLDAPEVFYRLLEKSIAMAQRDNRIDIALVRFRLMRSDGQPLFRQVAADELEDAASGIGNAASGLGNVARELRNADEFEAQGEAFLARANELAFAVAKLGKHLTDLVRSDENVARLGEVTFVLVARVAKEGDLEGLLRRFEASLSQLDLTWSGDRLVVEIESFTYHQGENLLDLLERAHL